MMSRELQIASKLTQDYNHMERLLSIIIPMYNAEKYIGTCLDSIVNSNLSRDDYEIIIVNDGSKDKGPDIAKDYVSKYDNIFYISQDNQGQSAARNNGVANCHGKYIWFVDSDDKISDNPKDVLELIKNNTSLDILAFWLVKVNEEDCLIGSECTQPKVVKNKIIKGRDAIIQGYNPSSVCALIINKDLMVNNDLYFHEGMTHQDVELSYKLFAHANDVMFVTEAPYTYIIHPNSTSQSIKPEKKIKYLSDDCLVIESFNKLAEKFKKIDPKLSEVISRRAKDIQFGMVVNLFGNRGHWRASGISEVVLDNMRKQNLFPLNGNFGNPMKNVAAKLFNSFSFLIS